MTAFDTSPHICARVYGGLGNQCFIYAAARAVADRVSGALTLDSGLIACDAVFRRSPLLPEFRIRAAHSDTRFGRWPLLLRRLQMRLHPYLPWRSSRWLIERTPPRFQPQVCSWHGKRVTVDGYWQSERYFADAVDAIRQDLTLLRAPEFEASAVSASVRAAEHPVFLHVRSYREVPGRQDGSFALPPAYFRNAVAHIRSQVRNPEFFLFSDDPLWAIERLSLPAGVRCSVVTLEPGAGSSPLRDFHVMTLCRHAVVANSSFSWWAAWLGEQRRRRLGVSGEIVCPAGPRPNPDYYPSRWQTVAIN